MTSVELHDCFYFNCEDCGREVLVHYKPYSMMDIITESDMAELAEDAELLSQILGDTGGVLHDKPSEVTCPHCDVSFSVDEGDQ